MSFDKAYYIGKSFLMFTSAKITPLTLIGKELPLLFGLILGFPYICKWRKYN